MGAAVVRGGRPKSLSLKSLSHIWREDSPSLSITYIAERHRVKYIWLGYVGYNMERKKRTIEEARELKTLWTLEDKAGNTGLIRYRAIWSGCSCCKGQTFDVTASPQEVYDEMLYFENERVGDAHVEVIITGVDE